MPNEINANHSTSPIREGYLLDIPIVWCGYYRIPSGEIAVVFNYAISSIAVIYHVDVDEKENNVSVKIYETFYRRNMVPVYERQGLLGNKFAYVIIDDIPGIKNLYIETSDGVIEVPYLGEIDKVTNIPLDKNILRDDTVTEEVLLYETNSTKEKDEREEGSDSWKRSIFYDLIKKQ